jgi:hypothetical protein
VPIGSLVTLGWAVSSALLILAVVWPFYGWEGLRTIGPAVGLAGVLTGWAAGATTSRTLSGISLASALAAVGLIVWRLSTPFSVPVVFRTVLQHARSAASLDLALAGAFVCAATAALQLAWLLRDGGPERPSLQAWRAPSSRLSSEQQSALAAAWRATLSSRVLVWGAGVLTVLQSPPQTVSTGYSLARPFGYLGTLLTTPASAWDAGNYLTIARYGYAAGARLDAYLPIYPALIRLGAWSGQAALITAIAVSVIALAIALYLLHRLVTLERGMATANLAVLLVAFFPIALFYSAVYTEAVFLLLTVGAFYSARREWWARAGILGGLAAATRVTGILLLVPLLVMYLFGPRGLGSRSQTRLSSPRLRFASRYPLRADFAFLLLVPLGFLLVLAYHGAHGDWLASLHAERTYWHLASGPLRGVFDGAKAFGQSILQILGGPTSHHLPYLASNQLLTPARLSVENIVDFGFLAFGCVATVGAFRRLPAAYGAYCLVTIAFTTSNVSYYQPLVSFPRYLMVAFPCQIWLALWAQRRPHRRLATVIASAGLLALFAGQFATWTWVA